MTISKRSLAIFGAVAIALNVAVYLWTREANLLDILSGVGGGYLIGSWFGDDES